MFIDTEEHTKATCLSKHKRNPKRSLTLENLVFITHRIVFKIAKNVNANCFAYVNLVQTNLQISINETYTPSVLNCNNYDFG